MASTPSMLDAALFYAQMGMSVIPLRGKRPYFDNWTHVATSDRQMVTKWWTQSPGDNIGVVTGSKSNVFVLDIDPKNGGDKTFERLLDQHGTMPDTWVDHTGGGGYHYYFRLPTFPVASKPLTAYLKPGLPALPGIDIKGEGGQVVVPPSIHPDTHRLYEWEGMYEGLENIRQQQIKDAPLWLLELIAPVQHGKPRTTISTRIPHGMQHMTLVSLGGALRRVGLTAEEIFPTLWAVNERRCEQPGPQANIEAIAHSMMKYEPDARDLFTKATELYRKAAFFEAKYEALAGAVKPVPISELMAHPPVEPKCVVENLLYSGLTILAGRPKSGKSFFTLQLALAVANGAPFMHSREIVKPGRVAYAALEEGPPRTAARIRKFVPEGSPRLDGIEFIYKLPTLANGGIQSLDVYLEGYKPNVLIIDTFLAFVGTQQKNRDVLRGDYQEIKALQELALKHDVAILVVHHTRKDSPDSGIDSIAGSTGVTAAADCLWVLNRQPQGRAALAVTGREIEEQTLMLHFDLGSYAGWTVLAEGDEAVSTEQREDIILVLRDGGPMSPQQIATELNKNRVTIRRLLQNMLASGLVYKNAAGLYVATGY